MTQNAQYGAVHTGFAKKKIRHLDVMRGQHGQATQQVIASKEQQQRQQEMEFNQQQQKQSIANQQRAAHDARKQANRSKNINLANTGLNLFQSIMSFF